jgi:hypothetical protein
MMSRATLTLALVLVVCSVLTHAKLTRLSRSAAASAPTTHRDVPPKAGSAADYLVTDLPGLPNGSGLTQYAGYVNVDPVNNGNLFFWLMERKVEATAPCTCPVWL